MRARTALIAALGLGACTLAGWMAADRADGVTAVGGDGWNARLRAASQRDAGRLDEGRFDALLASGFLPPEDEANGAGEATAPAADPQSAFPRIVGAAVVNNQNQVHLLIGDTVVSKRAGDTLESGWDIVQVDMDTVVASRDGEATEFPVADY